MARWLRSRELQLRSGLSGNLWVTAILYDVSAGWYIDWKKVLLLEHLAAPLVSPNPALGINPSTINAPQGRDLRIDSQH